MLMAWKKMPAVTGRSRKGAWIEMLMAWKKMPAVTGRSREGAWIEIYIRGIETGQI